MRTEKEGTSHGSGTHDPLLDDAERGTRRGAPPWVVSSTRGVHAPHPRQGEDGETCFQFTSVRPCVPDQEVQLGAGT